ncbi:MAG: acyl-CoA dehydrogenase family protein [Candidatus Competibacterales bacterium]
MGTLFEPTAEHAALRELARRFAEREVAPGAMARDCEERSDLALLRALGALGLLGITIPEAYGGVEMDAVAAVIVHEELAWADAGFALAYLSHSILFLNGLARHGDPDRWRDLLAEGCRGQRIGAVAISESEAGTDVLAMRTRARWEGDRYILNGVKLWITNGAFDEGHPADVVLVYARTSDQGTRGLSLFLVERGMPGFFLGRSIRGKLGMRSASCGELRFEGCALSPERRIGAEGAALMQMLRTLELERITLAAIGTGIALRALEIMNRYASDRQVEGRPLREYGQIQRHIAESYAELMAARAYLYATAAALDLERPGRGLGADGSKLVTASTAKAVADRAIQVLGGNGYVADYEVERLWRDARLLAIGGGSNEALQKNITRNLSRERGRLS